MPAGFARVGIMFGQEAAAVALGENAGKSPFKFRKHSNIEQINDEQVAGFRALHADGAAEVMNLRQIDFQNVAGVVVVLNLAAGPIDTLHAEFLTRFHVSDHRDIRMPAVVN